MTVNRQSIAPNKMLIFGILIYVIIFLLYYPLIFAFRDESSYLSMAYVLGQGKIFIENSGIPFPLPLESNGHLVPLYPLGQSLLLLPLTFLGWKSIFFVGLVFHLVAVIFFSKLLKIFELKSKFFPLLLLFFPAAVFYSRTIMSDTSSAALFTIACYFYFKPNGSRLISGLFFGMATLVRNQNLLLCLPFLAASFISLKGSTKYKKGILLFSGMVPFIILIAVINNLYYGSPFLTGYTRFKTFSLMHILPNLKHYSISLMISYPFMLLSLFFAKKTRKIEIYLSIAVCIFLISLHCFHDIFPDKLLTQVFGVRLLFPVIPLFLLCYAEFLENIIQKLGIYWHSRLVFFTTVALILCSIVINYQHQQALKEQLALKELAYNSTEDGSVLIYDSNSAELLQGVWGDRVYLSYGGTEKLVADLKSVDNLKKIYFLKRDVIYGRRLIKGTSEDELKQIGRHYNLEIVDKSDGLWVLRLIGKSPS